MGATKTQFIEQALTWVGVPYHHQQCSRYGSDCIGYLLGTAMELGYDWRGYDMPERTPNAQGNKLLEYIERLCTPTEQPEPGDLLVFRVRVDPQHCGLLLPNNQLIHCSSNARKVTVVDFSERWREHQIAAYVLPL